MKTLAVILLLSFALSSSHALYPAGSKEVIIRIDDIQDYPVTSPDLPTENRVLQYQIDARIPSLLAIIAADFGTEQGLVDQIHNGLDQGIFTLALHGWTHTPYTTMSQSTQTANMQYAKDKVQSIFGVQVFTFIPPYDNFNDATIAAMRSNQLTVISSADYTGDFPREQDGIMYIPGTVTTANLVNQTSWEAMPLETIVQQIRESWDIYGVAIVVIHPQQFTGEQDIWDIYLRMLDWIPKNGGTIIKLEPPAPTTQYTFDPLQLSIGILIGMLSTLLIYSVVKRSNGKNQPERELRTSSSVISRGKSSTSIE
jgi:hypothetical protein